MRSIAIENGDIVVRDKRLQIVDEKKQIIQKIAGVLSIYKGELFYNADVGIDKRMLFPENKTDDTDDMKRLAIIEALSEIEEIDSVDGFEFIKEKQRVIANMKVRLKSGETIETGGIPLG